MDCVSFWVWVASGVAIVPLLAFLKKLPEPVGPIVSQAAWLLAPLLAAVAPVLAQWGTGYCGAIDPNLWTIMYLSVSYLVSQLVYWLGKKYGFNV